MRDVMVNGRKIRPYMKTRMPQYGEEKRWPSGRAVSKNRPDLRDEVRGF